jgi:hypothetical protein
VLRLSVGGHLQGVVLDGEVDDISERRACTELRAVLRKAPSGLAEQPRWRAHAVTRPLMRPPIKTATSLV